MIIEGNMDFFLTIFLILIFCFIAFLHCQDNEFREELPLQLLKLKKYRAKK